MASPNLKSRLRSTKLKKNDMVMVVSGRSRGKSGKILRILKGNQRVIVEGLSMVKKSMRRRKQEDKGGIANIESPIHISNVMPLTRSGKRSRITVQRPLITARSPKDSLKNSAEKKEKEKHKLRLLTKSREQF